MYQDLRARAPRPGLSSIGSSRRPPHRQHHQSGQRGDIRAHDRATAPAGRAASRNKYIGAAFVNLARSAPRRSIIADLFILPPMARLRSQRIMDGRESCRNDRRGRYTV